MSARNSRHFAFPQIWSFHSTLIGGSMQQLFPLPRVRVLPQASIRKLFGDITWHLFTVRLIVYNDCRYPLSTAVAIRFLLSLKDICFFQSAEGQWLTYFPSLRVSVQVGISTIRSQCQAAYSLSWPRFTFVFFTFSGTYSRPRIPSLIWIFNWNT